jgi:hypothetical protein
MELEQKSIKFWATYQSLVPRQHWDYSYTYIHMDSPAILLNSVCQLSPGILVIKFKI